jgi:hypothetical protein
MHNGFRTANGNVITPKAHRQPPNTCVTKATQVTPNNHQGIQSPIITMNKAPDGQSRNIPTNGEPPEQNAQGSVQENTFYPNQKPMEIYDTKHLSKKYKTDPSTLFFPLT